MEDVFVPDHHTVRLEQWLAIGVAETAGYALHGNPLYGGSFLAVALGELNSVQVGAAPRRKRAEQDRPPRLDQRGFERLGKARAVAFLQSAEHHKVGQPRRQGHLVGEIADDLAERRCEAPGPGARPTTGSSTAYTRPKPGSARTCRACSAAARSRRACCRRPGRAATA